MRHFLAKFAILAMVLFAPFLLKAQDVASLTGVVTDATGAVLPGVSVTLTSPGTGSTYQATTNAVGSYTISRVPPGPGYQITFAHSGFSSITVSNVYLNVGATRTQNAQLVVGTVTTAVEVSAASQGVTLNTTDATVGNNFQVQFVNDLPIAIRDSPAALFAIQPGTTLDGAVTGARTDQNNVTLDGLDVNDMATGQAFAIVGNAPVDSIQEFRGVAAGPLASNGQGGGGQFELVTKSGTNVFHGALVEYHRNTVTAANDWFNNNAGVPRPALIRNQFGGNIGGPVLKDKLFFFFDYNGRRDVRSFQVLRTVPLDSFRNGTLHYILNKDASGNTCTGASRGNTTPQCIGTLTSAQVAALDPQHVGFNTALLASINKRYPHANDLTGGDGINTGGFRFNAPRSFTLNDYVGRADYNLNSSMKLWGRVSFVRQNSTQKAIEFPGDPETFPFLDKTYAYVFGHTWNISPTKLNQFAYGETHQDYAFPNSYNPTGTSQFILGGDGVGGNIVSYPYGSAINAQSRVIPIPIVRDDFSWQKGQHNFQFGGTFKFINSRDNTILNYDQPLIGLGGNLPSLDASLRPSDIRKAGTISSSVYDSAFSLALGRYASVNSTYNYDNKGKALPQGTGSKRSYRYYETELYFGDTWKATPSLTLSYGLRYQLYSVPYETNGLESIQNFTFDKYFGARVAQSAAGQSGNSAVPLLSYTLGGKANHASGYYQPSYKNFAPRFSFAYNPGFDRKSVFNGGIGIIYDHTVVNAVQYQQDQYSYLFQTSANEPFGVPGNPRASLLGDPRFSSFSSIPTPPPAPTITHPFQPFVDETGTPFGLADGQAFSEAIDPNLKNPYSIAFNFGFQHEIPGNFILKTGYVGRLGRRLLGQVDANQLIDFPDKQSGQLLSAAFGNITQQLRANPDPAAVTPQPWFENQAFPGATKLIVSALGPLVQRGDFADTVQALAANGLIAPNVGMGAQFSENTFYTNKGFSTYHGLLTTLHKNESHGLEFDINYTWSHSIDNVSVIANAPAIGGYGFICDALRPKECRGNSDFDVTQSLNGDFIYNLPFGRGRDYGANIPFWLNEAVGGWSISGLPTWHTGLPYFATTNAFVAGYANNAPAILVGDPLTVNSHVHKTSDGTVYGFADADKAFNAFTGPVGFTIGSRNNLRGPSYFNLDLGLGKTFPVVGDRVYLKFRADAFNALNHASFDAPNVDLTSSAFGQITTTASTARVMQFALRLEF